MPRWLALHELPGARILIFDRELRFILTAGETLEHHTGGESPIRNGGAFVGDAFPESLWKLIEPLCRSALDGETRSREMYADERRTLMVNVGPLRLEGPVDRSGQASDIAGGVAVILDITARRALAGGRQSSPMGALSRSSNGPRSGWDCWILTVAGRLSIELCARSPATRPRNSSAGVSPRSPIPRTSTTTSAQ